MNNIKWINLNANLYVCVDFLLLMPRIPVILVMRGSNGYGNNTEEQWNEFSNNYKNGNYKVA